MKQCSKCKNIHEISCFHKNLNYKDGLDSRCKFCRKKLRRIDYLQHREKQLKQCKKYIVENKSQIKENQKKYYIENKIIIDKKIKNYYQKNIIKMKEYYKNYRDNHKKHNNKYLRQKRKTNIQFQIICNLRTRLCETVKNNVKSASTKELLGCTVKFLKRHLELQFTEGMAWNNHGRGWHGKREWHIDHIKPCDSFDLSKFEEQRKCFHYSNLQPLWALDNLKKGSKIQ